MQTPAKGQFKQFNINRDEVQGQVEILLRGNPRADAGLVVAKVQSRNEDEAAL